MVTKNPFAPTFGAEPPVIAGRDDIFDTIADALETGPTHPDYTTLLLGVRGSGKTVMLDAVQDMARRKGWLAVSDDAPPVGLLGRLARAAARLLDELEDEPRRRIRSVTAAGFGVEFEPVADSDDRGLRDAEGLRIVLAALGDALAARGTGLMITLDELLSGDLDEIRQFGSVMQHICRREGRPVAFVGAALSQFEDELESDDAATFLQRCSRYDMERLAPGSDPTRHLQADRGPRCHYRSRCSRAGRRCDFGIRVHGPTRRVSQLGGRCRPYVAHRPQRGDHRHLRGSPTHRKARPGPDLEGTVPNGPALPARHGRGRWRIAVVRGGGTPRCGHQLRRRLSASANSSWDDRVHRPRSHRPLASRCTRMAPRSVPE